MTSCSSSFSLPVNGCSRPFRAVRCPVGFVSAVGAVVPVGAVAPAFWVEFGSCFSILFV